MVERSNRLLKKGFIFVIFLANSICMAYTLSTRFTDILFAPKPEKVLIFSGYFILAAILSALIYIVWLRPIIFSINRKSILIITTISLIFVAIIFSAFYQFPPFPAQHSLTVKALGEKSENATNSRVEVIAFSTITYPNKEQRKVLANQFEYDGEWRAVGDSDYMLAVTDGTKAAFGLRRFMQSGAQIEFQRGPDCGIVSVSWDGDETIIDLYHNELDTYNLNLEPAFRWKRADRTRKLFIGAALLSDLFIASSLLIIISLTVVFVYKNHTHFQFRKSRFFFISVLIVFFLLFILQQVNTPIAFNNPQIEAGIREALNQPAGKIYHRQLQAIAILDLSGMEVADLDGLEQLSNLVELNLENNQIINISPISALTKLQKLNLKNNNINDLTPLALLNDLEYLNLYGNANINSLEPLSSLSELRKLILAKVPVGEDPFDFGKFQKLTYLNLRECGIKDINSLANLTELQYLNLHSNSEISSIQAIEKLNKLETLMLANIALGDETKIISSLKDLQYLNLRNTGLSDIEFLSPLLDLEYLNLHSNPDVSSIAPIQNLTNLEDLILRDVPVEEESIYLADLVNLQSLNIRNTGISDIAFLADIMSNGALQDNPKQSITASIDLRDNPIENVEGDAYASIRPYWQNIAFAEPGALPFFAELDPPKFSHPSGFYSEPFFLTLIESDPNVSIYYTLDGGEPTINSKIYSEPIYIEDRTDSPNIASGFENIASDWHKPESEVQKAFIFRAIAINENENTASPIITNTYFVGENIQNHYSLPVISLVTRLYNFFDDETGIYVFGNDYEEIKDDDISEDEKQKYANFDQHGEEWERPIHIEVFNTTNESVFSQNGGVRIHGSGSRRSAQKSLRLYADCIYDFNCEFNYQFFDESENAIQSEPKYGTILLRNNGQDWMIGMMRDSVGQNLLKKTNLDTQSEQPVVVFLNGEYWGIYQLQERYDQYYLLNEYGLEEHEVTILRQNGGLSRGNESDAKNYRSLVNFLETHDLSDAGNYDFVKTQIDIENYIDYLIANIYLGNSDWPDNNIYIWKKSLDTNDLSAEFGHDGRWRWMIFDLDFGLGLQGYGTGYQHNTLKLAQKEGWSGEIFRSLLENEAFRIEFINKFADHMNSTFTSERVIYFIDQHQETIAPEMEEFFARWGSNNEGQLEKWYEEVEIMRKFAINRPTHVYQHVIDQFGLSGFSNLSLVNETDKGSITINSLELSESASWSGKYFNDVPITITANPKQGYRFSHWEGIDAVDSNIEITLSSDLILIPVFIEDQSE